MSSADLDLPPWVVVCLTDEKPEAQWRGELLAQGHTPILGWGQQTWVLDWGPQFGEGEVVERLGSGRDAYLALWL